MALKEQNKIRNSLFDAKKHKKIFNGFENKIKMLWPPINSIVYIQIFN